MVRAGTASGASDLHPSQSISSEQIRKAIIRLRKNRNANSQKNSILGKLSQLKSGLCMFTKMAFAISCMGIGSALSSYSQVSIISKLIEYSSLEDEELGDNDLPLDQLLVTSAIAMIGSQITLFGQELILRTYFPNEYERIEESTHSS
ncbi:MULTISPECIES: hypothetical protein [Candidatus Ichthyocystis]|uniref:Uncharacterized protein n=1 Tax=Candidatus Ichthyocystis hellenicum TaxID=1561003 RepID=A0A0S4M9I8_9BURK|nr:MULTISPECIES: hypothetical protein [Ichthyocystis]CUT18132.1 hypothetical protein Ark11_1328 [Candidatus Ichthyocystis hellenicum]